MARLHIMNLAERRVEVVLSRRNLLTLLHKLDMPHSQRQIENNDCWEDGEQTPWYPGESNATSPPRTILVLRCEHDGEHYAGRAGGPGIMHPESERFVQENGGVPGEMLSLEQLLGANDRAGEDHGVDGEKDGAGENREAGEENDGVGEEA
ncbi:MAG: hypothetical protein H0X39_05550 [Actinobacteria bacterium]|nr:hypothetical protein [Actinomycetota bacterium]